MSIFKKLPVRLQDIGKSTKNLSIDTQTKNLHVERAETTKPGMPNPNQEGKDGALPYRSGPRHGFNTVKTLVEFFVPDYF